MELVDTNIIVYAFDSSEGNKHEEAKKLLVKIMNGEREACVSNQVLAEFFVAVTEKIEKPLAQSDAAAIIAAIIETPSWKKMDYDHSTVLSAAKNAGVNKTQFWDALIAQTAIDHGVSEIVTEDETVFKKMGLKTINPFKK